jgi:hypothetical protein
MLVLFTVCLHMTSAHCAEIALACNGEVSLDQRLILISMRPWVNLSILLKRTGLKQAV